MYGKNYVSGITTNDEGDIHNKRITPYTLFERLKRVKGKKAIIIDACYSGAFVEEIKHRNKFNEPPITRSVVITSTTEEGISIIGFWDCLEKRLRKKYISNVASWLYNNRRKRINLSEIPLINYSMSQEAYQYRKEGQEIAEKVNLQIQRISDTDFIF